MIDIYSMPGFTHPLSSIIHFLGALFFTYLAYFLIQRGKGSSIRIISLAVFSSSCVFLLVISAVYHLLETSGKRIWFFNDSTMRLFFWSSQARLLQYTCILFTSFLRWGFVIIIWILAIIGLLIKTIYFTTIPEWLGWALIFNNKIGWLATTEALKRFDTDGSPIK
jgi:channel protein (hemolysin III family)